MTTLSLADAHLIYPSTPPVHALRGVDLHIGSGEFVAIEGPSGGGKSTLMNVLGLLNVPTRGVYLIDGDDASAHDARALAERRSTTFSFVFQSFHLLERRPVVDSVELGLLYRAVEPAVRRQLSLDALEAVGLRDRWDQDASTLSGGQRQRVAIARALASAAPVVLADEPTGNLDSESSAAVLAALRTLHARGATVVIVTHDRDIAAQADRRIKIRDGICTTDSGSRSPTASPLPAVTVGHPARLRFADLLRDAVASIRSRRGRAAGLSLAVAVGVALAVGTTGLAMSASAQVASTFDARENRYVTVIADPPEAAAVSVTGRAVRSNSSLEKDLRALAGVDAATVVVEYDQHRVSSAPHRPGEPVSTLSATGGLAEAAQMSITWATSTHDVQAGYALIGHQLAENIALGPLVASPAVFVDGRPLVVAGIIDDGGRMPELTGAVVVSDSDGPAFGYAGKQTSLILTRPGAAQQVAGQAPLVLDPTDPDRLGVQAPTDPRDLRASIQSDVSTILAVLTAIALLASIVGLANAMVLAVIERRQEFGLRRAVGSRPSHVVALVLSESTIIGAVGGVIGLAVGVGSILAITIGQRWAPVFDLRLAPLAVVGGVVVGALGGVVAAIRASHIQPSEALRQ